MKEARKTEYKGVVVRSNRAAYASARAVVITRQTKIACDARGLVSAARY